MVTAIVLSPSYGAPSPHPRAAEAVARSLGALVRGSVEGILREAIIVGPAADELEKIADHAGCGCLIAPDARQALAGALDLARCDMVFALQGGYGPQASFVEETGDLLLNAGFSGALLRRWPEHFLSRLAPGLSRPVGAIASREKLRRAAGRDFVSALRRLRLRQTLSAHAYRLV